MNLSALLAGVEHSAAYGAIDRPVADVTQDSRRAGPSSVFVAVRGHTVDGHTFAPDLDVAAVVAERKVPVRPGVTLVLVPDSRRALAGLAAALHGHPSAQTHLVGVTGTNGKTSTCWMLEAIGRAAGRRVGVIGTTGHRVDGRPVEGGFTTPEAPAWQALLHQMVDGGCDLVAAEVSSIGLADRRVDATRFAVGVYTNLTQDHLDFHGDMAAYGEAKARLFRELLPPGAAAALNLDDPAPAALLGALPAGVRPLSFGLTRGDVHVEGLVLDGDGARGRLVTPLGDAPFRLSLLGRHNVSNALGAAAAAVALGVSPDDIAEGLARLGHIPGRLEPVPNDRGVTVLVDYAHTPDALERVLGALREVGRGRLLVVFGCGGERDRAKRPLMARAATEGADVVIATSDNPRREDPLAILDDVRPGLGPDALVEPDRAAAIALAVRLAAAGDVLLISGKGHERTQQIGSAFIPFDDREVAARALGGAA